MSKYTSSSPIFSDPPTVEQVSAIFSYNREAGTLSRRRYINKAKAGETSSRPSFYGYLRTCYRGREYKVHRLIYLLETGEYPEQIDHINGVMTDNRIINLRAAGPRENSINRKMANRSRSTPLVGVHVVKKTGRFRATIGLHRKIVCLGNFVDFFEAACARKSAELVFGYHRNHGRSEDARASYSLT